MAEAQHRPLASLSCTVRKWAYLRSEHPNEALLHLTAHGTRFCFHRGRQHKSQLVMISIDLLRGVAFQRCWDSVDCVEEVRGVTLKCKHRLGRPAAALPSLADLLEYEKASDNHRSAPPAPMVVD